jgi:hypothetical protein
MLIYQPRRQFEALYLLVEMYGVLFDNSNSTLRAYHCHFNFSIGFWEDLLQENPCVRTLIKRGLNLRAVFYGISLRMIQRHFQTILISSGSGIQSAKIIEIIKAKMGDTVKRHATVVLPAL